MILPLLLTFVVSGLSAATPVERCRAADADFDYERAIKDCGFAAADASLSAAERIEVIQLLGIAHTATGDEDVGREWFVRLLTVDPTYTMPPEVSPVYKKAFERARERFEAEGQIAVTHTAAAKSDVAAGRFDVGYTMSDRFGRVSKALVEVNVTEGEPDAKDARTFTTRVALVEGARTAEGERVFTAPILDPSKGAQPPVAGPYTLVYRLELLAADGSVIVPSEALTDPRYPLEAAAAPVVVSETEEGIGWALPLGLGGGAAAVVVLGLGASGAAAATCLLTSVCTPAQQPQSNTGQARIGVAQ